MKQNKGLIVKICLFFLLMTSSKIVYANSPNTVEKSALTPPPTYDVSNDSMFFDLGNAQIVSTGGNYFYDIPVSIKSNGPINSFDFWFKFDLTKLTYDTTINVVGPLDPYTYYNPMNQLVSNTTSGPSASYLVPMNTTLIKLRFQLAGACTAIDIADFNTITTLLNGSVCKHKFKTSSSSGGLIVTNPPVICDGSLVNFSTPTVYNGRTINAWSWDLGNGATANTQSTSTTYNGAASYTVNLNYGTVDGCTFNYSDNITANVLPTAQFTYTIDPITDSIYFTNTSSPVGSTYSWSFGDNTSSTAFEPVHTYAAGGSYSVILTAIVAGACTDQATQTIIIDMPVAGFFVDQTCSGLNTQFTDTSSYVLGSIVGWQWNFGDGTNSNVQNPVHVFSIAGDYPVTLQVLSSAGQLVQTTQIVHIDSKPLVDFAAATPIGCAPFSVNFNNITFTDAGSTYFWSFGDDNFSSQVNPAHVYTNSGQYSVRLIVTSPAGCTDSTTKINYINSQAGPTAAFSYSEGCVNSPIQFTEIVTPGLENQSWQWNFANGQTSNQQNPSQVFLSSGTYSVVLTVTNPAGCSDDVTLPVSINSKPTVNFTSPVTDGCSPLAINFSSTSTTAPGSTYQWNFGNGSSASIQNPTYTYGDQGLYDVELIVTAPGGCSDSLTIADYIDVLSGIVADFSNSQNCAGLATGFTDLSSSSTGATTSWNWNFGNGNSSTLSDPVYVYLDAGTFNVSLIVSTDQGCSDTIVKPVVIEDKPIVNFAALPAAGCSPLSVTFDDLSTTPLGSTYLWDFGNGDTSSLQNPTEVYVSTANYSVLLQVTTPYGCVDSLLLVDAITMEEHPTAAYLVSNDTAAVPQAQIDFMNESVLSTSVSWSFGDGTYSNEEDPIHIFADTGIYEVCLTAVSQYGCTDTLCENVYILATNNVAIPGAFTPNGDGANDVLYVRGGPFKTIRMQIFNEWGNLIFESTDQSIGWTGNYRGVPQPSGSYEYIIKGETLDNENVNLYGVIHLNRY
jgi:gliding motility-associated-like protein